MMVGLTSAGRSNILQGAPGEVRQRTNVSACDPATALHATPLHATPLHATPLHATPLHATPLHATPLHATPGDSPTASGGQADAKRISEEDRQAAAGAARLQALRLTAPAPKGGIVELMALPAVVDQSYSAYFGLE